MPTRRFVVAVLVCLAACGNGELERQAGAKQPRHIATDDATRVARQKKKGASVLVAQLHVACAHSWQIQNGRDLSAQDGRVVLVEYIEQQPVLIANVGMGARMPCYSCKPGHTKETGFNPPAQPLEDGEYLPYNPEQDNPPLLG